MTNGAKGAHGRGRVDRAGWSDTGQRYPGRTGATRDRRPRRELDGPCDSCVRASLPAPVELGLGLHSDRLLDVGPGTRARGAQVDLRRPVDERVTAAYPFRQERTLFSGTRVLADRSLAARACGSADVRDRAAAGPRDCRLEGLPPRARRGRGEGLPSRTPAQARRVARLSLPRAHEG